MPVDEEEQLAIGAIKASSSERKKIAAFSSDFKCQECENMRLGDIAAQSMLEPSEDL
jgi:hypothetical protein